MQERACRQALEWHQLRPDARPFDVAVNLSARQVAHRDLPATVEEIIARTGLDPVHLRLEITESVLVEESATAISSLEALNESASASSSTTSAPATPRSPTSTAFPSTR